MRIIFGSESEMRTITSPVRGREHPSGGTRRLASLLSRLMGVNRWRTQTPIPVEVEAMSPLSAIFATFPDHRESAFRSRLSELSGEMYLENPVGQRARMALWTSAGHVMVPRLAGIVDDLQLEIRGVTYDDGTL